MERKAQSHVYDLFSDYVDANLKRDHPNISLQKFSNVGKGPTHLIIGLQHVQAGVDVSFMKTIEDFKKGTKCKTEEDKTGMPMFKAHVPWNDQPQVQQQQPQYYQRPNGPPNSMLPVLYGFCAMLLILIAVVKTSASDWEFIIGKK